MKRFFIVTACLFIMAFRLLAQDPMVLEFNTNLSDGTTITLPLQGTVNVNVNWGDGNEETFSFADNYSHTYSEEGTYTVTISGSLSQFGNGWFGYSNPQKLVRVTSFGDLGLESLYGAFYHATNIIEVPTILPATVTNLSETFSGATSFNSDISSWVVGSVTDISAMFMNASLFNQDISGWDVGNVTNMRYAFYYASEFNQNIGGWNVGNVTDMSNMFEGASSFDQNIGGWNVSNVTSMAGMFMPGMFNTVKLSPANYNSLLLGWSAQTLQSNVTFHAGTSKYSPDVATDARGILTNTFGWTITDGGTWNLPLLSTAEVTSILASTAKSGGNITASGGSEITARGVVWHTQSNPTLMVNTGFTNEGTGTGEFVSNLTDLVGGQTYYVRAYATNSNGTEYGQEEVFETFGGMILVFNTNLSDGTTITLPLLNNVNVTVNWGDGSTNNYTTSGNRNHTYAINGEYTVTIKGKLSSFGNWNYSNADKLVKVISFGNIGIIDLSCAFQNAKNLIEVPQQIPQSIINLSHTFNGATAFNYDISNWDVSNVRYTRHMFYNATSFNQNIGMWNVSNVTNMSGMFYRAESFNQYIGNWDVSNVKDMTMMFSQAYSFNQDIGDWIVSNVYDMWGMFEQARSFNQDIGKWDVSNVTDMGAMFSSAESFNQDIGKWDVGKVINMYAMFSWAISFNQDIGNWDVSNVNSMSFMFNWASSFNQNISMWDVSNVNSMSYMFNWASSFNQNISMWDVSSVTNFEGMFRETKLSTAYYNSLLIGWAEHTLQNNMTFHAGTSKYSPNEPANARQYIIDTYGWTITDGGTSSLPAILTDQVSEITPSSAASGGVVSNEGGSLVIARGIVWNTTPNPTLADNIGFTSEGAGLGSFSSVLSDLVIGTKYYVRAYATNSNGTEYGNSVEFTAQQELTLSGNFTSNNKVYDRIIRASVLTNELNLNGVITGSNDVSIESVELEFDNKNVGDEKKVSIVRVLLTGSDKNKYFVSYENAPFTTANITPKGLFISGIKINNKIYDGTINANVSNWGIIRYPFTGDDVNINHSSATAVFDSKNVGNDINVTISGLGIEGNDAINYFLDIETYNSKANITKRPLTLSNFSAENKVYDGTTNAIGQFSDNRISDDDLEFSYNIKFTNKSIGEAKTVNFSQIKLNGGLDKSNYLLTTNNGSCTANITPRNLNLEEFTAESKVYNGLTNVLGSSFSDDRIIGDDLDFSYSALFSDKNIGELKDVFFTNIEISDGLDKNNYTLNTNTGTAKADISPKPLLITNFTSSNKVYDGSVDALGTSFSDDRIEGDNLVFAYTAGFVNKNVGVSKNVNFSDISIANGLDKNNYLLSTTSGTATANITPRTLNLSDFTADSKEYDGTVAVTGTGFNDDRIEGDNLEFTFSAEYSDKNVAEGKNVNFTNISISDGNDIDNYILASQTGVAVANITPRPLILSNFTADSKVYDGTTDVYGTGFTDDRIEGDILEFTYSARFSDKNVGESKVVSYTDIIISDGDDKNNYSLGSTVGSSTATITAKELTITGTFIALDKVYDGTTSATMDDNNLLLAMPVAGDEVGLFDIIIEFADAAVGTNKIVSIVSADLDGVDKTNYSLSLAGAPTATAAITQPVSVPSTALADINIYPNPFRDVIHISNSQNAARIVISDIIGKVVLDIDINQSSTQTITTNLPSGIYLVNIIAKDGTRVVRKMIKE